MITPAQTEYIQLHHSTYAQCYGQCQTAVTAMHKAFPELRIAKGHVYTSWGMRAHWWLVNKDDEIIDPTARQFPALFGYEEWKPGDELRVGKCVNCGEEIYRAVQSLDDVKQESICSATCHAAYSKYLEGGE